MNDLKVILDLGNGYIKGAVFSKEDGKDVVLAKEMVKTNGMRKGRILDVDDFIYSINSIFDSFVKKLGNDFLEDVYIGISHPDMKIKRINEQKRILNSQIGQDDMDHISNLIYEIGGVSNYETVKIIPVKWVIDDNMSLKDPSGMEGNKLELVADVFMVPKNFYNTLEEVFEKLDVGIIDIVPNILGSSEAVLDFDAKDLGSVLIDVGTNQTSYVVYEEGYPIKYGVVPIGGEEVTKDVSIGLQVDIKEAENIKREKGSIPEKGEKNGNDDGIDVGFLNDIMVARYEEIFEKINEDLKEIDRDGRLPGGVTLIGGGSKVKNLDELAKDVFKLATFFGEDKVMKISNLSNNLQFINLLGDNVWSNKYSGKEGGRGFSLGLDLSGMVKKVVKFFKDLF